MGIRDYFDGTNVFLVEWSDRGKGVLPPADLVINIDPEGSGRLLRFSTGSTLGDQVVNRFAQIGS